MSHLKDLTGKVCGHLYVIERLPNYRQENNRTRTRWLTYCLLCGKMYVAYGSHLLHGNIVSCGCLKNKKSAERMTATKGKMKKNSRTKDLKGKILNENILVLEVAPSKNGKRTWRCQCLLCGTIFDVRANHLLRGLVKSCGCVSSFAEKYIKEYFNKLKLKFKHEYIFDDLINPDTGHCLYFDFAFFGKDNSIIALLEYQGIQHDKNLRNGKEFGKLQREKTDDMKKAYCKENNLPLYEIWYYQDLKKALDDFCFNVLHVNPVPSFIDDKEGATTIP